MPHYRYDGPIIEKKADKNAENSLGNADFFRALNNA